MNDGTENIPKSIKPSYVSYKTFKNFLETLTSKGGCPDRIDSGVLPTMSGANQKHLMSSLKFLNLINEKHIASDRLAQLIESDKAKDDDNRKKILALVVKDAYSFLFENGFVERATTQQVEAKFRGFGISGDTVNKAIMFFIHITNDAGVAISQFIHPYKGKISKPSSTKPRKNGNKGSKGTAERQPDTPDIPKKPEIDPKKNVWMEQLLSKFPEFDPQWSPEVQTKWFESFEKLMKIKEVEE